MESLIQLFFLPLAQLLGFLLVGFFLGRLGWMKGPWIDRSLTVILYFLLFVMGWRTGWIPDINQQLGTMGLMALGFAVMALLGSWALVGLGQLIGLKPLPPYTPVVEEPEEGKKSPPKTTPPGLLGILKTPLILGALVVAGGLFGFLSPWREGVNLDNLSTHLVLILVFFVGVQTGGAHLDFKQLFGRPGTYLLPLLTALGSLAGGALFVVLFPSLDMSPPRGASVTGGFGWYSLSSVLLSSQLGAPILGTVAFLSNIFRETLSFFLIPLFARLGQSNLAISSGGATTMDVTLPLIEKTAGPEAVLPALAHGVILSLLVPFTVPIFFRLG